MARRRSRGIRTWAGEADEWIRGTPSVVFVMLLAVLLSSLITIFSSVSWVIGSYNGHFRWREAEYSKIESLHAGLSVQKFVEILGSPTFAVASDDHNLTEYTFKGRGYWVQAVHDTSGTVRLFALTACDESFRPVVESPLGKVKLNESTFDAPRSHPAFTRYVIGAQSASFYDEYYLGNPGFYKTYFLGISDACLDRGASGTSDDFFDAFIGGRCEAGCVWSGTDRLVAEFRALSVVNTYAETLPEGRVPSGGLHVPFGIGPDRILTRTLPWSVSL